MSERSCANCEKEGHKPEDVICKIECPHLGPFTADTPEKARQIAAICEHYEERAELCGAETPYKGELAGCFICCDLPKGHRGEHEGAGRRIRFKTAVPTKCEVGHEYGMSVYKCHKEQGHSGQHEATVRVGSPPTIITTLVWGDSDPAPTTFDKAWEEYNKRKPTGFYRPTRDYRAGWQARGRHMTDIIDERLKQLSIADTAVTKEQLSSLRSLVSGSNAGDECK